MSQQIKITFSDEEAQWLRVAKAAGISMSWLVRSLSVQAGQHCGLAEEVEFLIRRRIEQMSGAGQLFEAQRLEMLLTAAQYPVGYH